MSLLRRKEPHGSNVSQRRLGFIVTVFAAFAFASKTILVKLCYQYGVDPITVLALRMLFAGGICGSILLVNVLRGRWKLSYTARQWGFIVLLGVGGYYGSALLDFSGLVYIDANLGRMILFLHPTLVVVINSILKRKPVGGSVWLALGLCYAGIGLMMLPGVTSQHSANIWLGSAMIGTAALTYALYLVGVERLLTVIEPLCFTSVVMVVTSLSVAVHFLSTRPVELLLNAPDTVWFYGFLTGSFATAMPVYAFTYGVSRIGSSQAAMISMVGPVLTLIMGVALLNESLTFIQAIGMALVMLGVWRVGK